MRSVSRRKFVAIGLALAALVGFLCPTDAVAAGKKKTLGVVTVDFSSATMLRFSDAFTARAKSYGWDVIAVGCGGDYAKGIAIIEDFIAKGVDGIFNDMLDPNLIQPALKKAQAAGIPVINGDAGFDPKVITNVTSNNFVLSARISQYLFDKMLKDGKNELLVVTWPQHHGIRKRTAVMKTVLAEYPQIKLVEEHITYIPGQIEDSKKWMTNFLTGHPNFKGAVWCAWDEPAAGVTMAIEAAGKQKDIYTIGIDGNKWTFDNYIRKKGPFLATEAQNFEMMGLMIADIFKQIFDGKKKASDFPRNIFVPTLLITQDNIPPPEKFPWLETGPYRPEYEKLAAWP
jgi:ABC-type sugar transport system substrate-binding protein